MAADRGPGRGLALGQKYFATGLKFAAGIVFFMFAGFWLDRRTGTMPLFTVVGTAVGAVLSFVSVYQDVQKSEGRKGGRAARRKRR
jgi:F0F1-type ATP synthase assembly protein I